MSQIADQLGIQSYCFRHFSGAEALVEKTLECGVKKIELYPGHCDASSGDATAFLRTLADAGISMDAWFNGIPEDEAEADKVFETVAAAGCQVIVIGALPNNMQTASALCRKYSLRMAIHNHGRKHAYGSVAALDKVFDESGPEVGLCLDTAWMLDSGEDPVAVAEKYIDRLYGVHIKDFTFNRAGRPEDVVVGTGNLDLSALMKVLAKNSFEGALTLEFEGDPENPVPVLKQCVEKIVG